MKSRPIDQIVYESMFPKPKPTDPQNFQGLLQRQLVPEVRLETQAFYGHLSSQEAKYPGLNYNYQPHRNRLSRYPWHRRLFRALDNLRLTDGEIQALTKWEGTRWAKERFEREQGIVIRDTTADGIEDWVEPELRSSIVQPQRADVEDMDEVREDEEHEIEENDEEVDDDMEEASDDDMQSVGVALNERLRAAVAQREAGNAATVMDEEWEQWLKDAVESGGMPFLSTAELSPTANISGTRPAGSGPAYHPRLLNAARLGQWQQIPDFLHNMVRENVEAHNRRLQSATPSEPASASTAAATLTQMPYARRGESSAMAAARGHHLNDNHFADLFSRRPVPSLPPTASMQARLSNLRATIRDAPDSTPAYSRVLTSSRVDRDQLS